MFGSIGIQEIILIFIIVLLLFGPRKLPEIGKTIGKALKEFKRASNEVKRSFEEEIEKIEEAKISLKEEENKEKDELIKDDEEKPAG